MAELRADLPGTALARRPRLSPTLGLTAGAFAPILVAWLISAALRRRLEPIISVDLTNLDALRRVLASLLHPSTRADSWWPMLKALKVLDGPDHGALYETLFFQGTTRFQYPPTSLIPLDILSRLGLADVRWLNALNSLVLLALVAATGLLAGLLFRREAGEPASRARPGPAAAALLAAVATLVFYPVIRAHVLGQIQLWIDLLFTGALILWLGDRRLLAGALIGLACCIKPQLGLLALWGVIWGERRFVAGIALTLLPLGAVSVLRYGLHNHLAYLQVLSFLSRHGESFFANNSVNGILNWRLSGQDSLVWHETAYTPFVPAVYAGTVVASLAFLALIIGPRLFAKRRRAAAADLASAAICTVAGSPVAWEHHYGLLLPLFLLAAAHLFAQPAGPRRTAGALALLVAWSLVANFMPFASLLARTELSAAQAYCFFGALVLLGFFLAARRTPAPDRAFLGSAPWPSPKSPISATWSPQP